MNCAESRRLISESLDAAPQSAALSRHLAGCAGCSRVLLRARSLGAALASLSQKRPSAAFNAVVLAALTKRPYAVPLAPFILSLVASSAAVALAASRLSFGAASTGVLAAKSLAWAHAAFRVAAFLLPAPRLGAQFSAAALLAAALFLTISLPSRSPIRLIGAKS